jgi:hypothetical protein
MAAVGDLARGRTVENLRVSPQWGREAIPNPATAVIGSLPSPAGAKSLEYLAMDISADYIAHYKSQYNDAAHGGSWCSAFEVLVAKAWQSRTRAAGFDPDSDVHLCFAMNARPLLHAGRAPGAPPPCPGSSAAWPPALHRLARDPRALLRLAAPPPATAGRAPGAPPPCPGSSAAWPPALHRPARDPRALLRPAAPPPAKPPATRSSAAREAFALAAPGTARPCVAPFWCDF